MRIPADEASFSSPPSAGGTNPCPRAETRSAAGGDAGRPVDRRGLGILLVIAGSLALALVDSSAKWMMTDGLSAGQTIFIRFLVPSVFLAVVFLPRRGLAVLRTKSLKLEIARSICMVATTVLNFLAVQYLPLTITGSIAFTSPLILCLLSGLALGERVEWQRWLAILAGFVGVLVIVNPEAVSPHPAMLYSLGMAAAMALYAIFTRKLAGVDSNLTQQFYATLAGLLCSLPFAFQQWTWPPHLSTWIVCGLLGTAGLLGHTLYSAGHRFAPATTLAPFTYSQLIFMALISWAVFAQGPDLYFFIGLPILVGSGLFIWFREFSLATRRHRIG